jgi:hypothetical protein
MKFKKFLTCFTCFKIYRNPVILPCGHSICEIHIKSIDFRSHCAVCQKEFDRNVSAPMNVEYASIIDKKEHFNSNEKALFILVENELKTLHEAYDDFKSILNGLELNCSEHFAKLLNELDLQRECLKLGKKHKENELDHYYLEKVGSLKKHSEKYLSTIRTNFTFVLEFETKKKQEIEEFLNRSRSVNFFSVLLRQYKSRLIKRKLQMEAREVDMTEILESTKSTNSFLPVDDKFVGFLTLSSLWLNPLPSKLISYTQSLKLKNLGEFKMGSNWKLLYRATQHGFKYENFGKYCFNKVYSCFLFKVKETRDYGGEISIFGAYLSVPCEMITKHNGLTEDADGFIFTLSDKSTLLKNPYILRTFSDKGVKVSRFSCGDLQITQDKFGNLTNFFIRNGRDQMFGDILDFEVFQKNIY